MSDRPVARRPFLVVVRGGDDSLHRTWIKPGAPRKWDLLLDRYGPNSHDTDDCADFTNRGGITKFSSIKRIDTLWPGFLQSYEAVWFADGDIYLEFEAIDTLFDIFASYDLWLAQPSLSSASFYDHEICINRPLFTLRYVNFTEIMAPIFSRNGLFACMPTFDESVSGWGLDFVWPAALGQPQRRIAIIDAVQIDHTKKLDLDAGAFYQLLRSIGVDPMAEKSAVMEKYGVQHFYRTYGCILK